MSSYTAIIRAVVTIATVSVVLAAVFLLAFPPHAYGAEGPNGGREGNQQLAGTGEARERSKNPLVEWVEDHLAYLVIALAIIQAVNAAGLCLIILALRQRETRRRRRKRSDGTLGHFQSEDALGGFDNGFRSGYYGTRQEQESTNLLIPGRISRPSSTTHYDRDVQGTSQDGVNVLGLHGDDRAQADVPLPSDPHKSAVHGAPDASYHAVTEAFGHIVEEYNAATGNAAAQFTFENRFHPIRLGVNAVERRNDSRVTPKFSTANDGDYWAIAVGEGNLSLYAVVPRLGILLNHALYGAGAMGLVFKCPDYDSRMRYRMRVAKTARFCRAGDSDSEWVELAKGELFLEEVH